MKAFSAALLAQIDAGTTARLARVTLADATVLAWTDHDKPLTVDGTTFTSVAGQIRGTGNERTGATVDNQKFMLRRADATDQELTDGNYDDARIELGIVGWGDATLPFHWLHVYDLGALQWDRDKISVDIMGTMRALGQPLGGVFTPRCDVILGDSRCQVDLNAYKVSGTVTSVTQTRMQFSDTSRAEAEHYFSDGRITWLTGANAGKTYTIQYSNGAAITMQLPTLRDIAVGDTYEMTPGCDHTADTCRTKYSNGVNFQGFPFLRGETQLQ